MEVLVRDIIKKAEEKLKEAGVVDFAVDSWLLAEFVFKINRTGFYMDPMMTVSKERADKYMELVGIRASKIPLQHITGSQEFMGLDFKVNEDVLIPRQDTELLVENAITYIKSVKGNVDVLDMCTGSGCIAISIDRLWVAAVKHVKVRQVGVLVGSAFYINQLPFFSIPGKRNGYFPTCTIK